jgi:hypothetical protein
LLQVDITQELKFDTEIGTVAVSWGLRMTGYYLHSRIKENRPNFSGETIWNIFQFESQRRLGNAYLITLLKFGYVFVLTLSNPIFLPTAYSPALIWFGQ